MALLPLTVLDTYHWDAKMRQSKSHSKKAAFGLENMHVLQVPLIKRNWTDIGILSHD